MGDYIEMRLWTNPAQNLQFENDKTGQLTSVIFSILFGIFAMYSGFYFVLNEYYLQTMKKRNCECSEIDKLKQLKHIIISMIVVWILLMVIVYTKQLIIGPLVIIGLLLIVIHCIL